MSETMPPVTIIDGNTFVVSDAAGDIEATSTDLDASLSAVPTLACDWQPLKDTYGRSVVTLSPCASHRKRRSCGACPRRAFRGS
jgi:hypothetical protein